MAGVKPGSASTCTVAAESRRTSSAVFCVEWWPISLSSASGVHSTQDITGRTGETDAPCREALGRKVLHPRGKEILSHLPRRGISMVLRAVEEGKSKQFAFTVQHKVQRMRAKLELPADFTFDACRHGRMTELEEAELTDGQGRALSAHRTQQYIDYAKRTEKRMLAATRKRHAHRLANETATYVQNEQRNRVQNEGPERRTIAE
ncbi:hypothetical protein [Bradyrhizobium sp. UFLA05-112]